MSSASALATQPNARSLAPILQASLISGRDPAQSALFAPRSPTQLPAAAAQLEPGERLRFFRGQLVNRLRDEQHAGRIEVSSLSDVGGHGRYNGEEGSAISTADELSNVLPPSCVPERFHLHGANGRRIFPSENPTGRDEVEHLEAVYDTLLEEAGDDMLKQLDARDIVLAEIARQVHPHCAERSELLVRIKSLLYLHTSEALPLVDRVEAVEKALQEKREQLAAMEKDHAALTASRNRLNATPGAMPAKRVLRAAISDEIAAKVRRAPSAARRAHSRADEREHTLCSACGAPGQLRRLRTHLRRVACAAALIRPCVCLHRLPPRPPPAGAQPARLRVSPHHLRRRPPAAPLRGLRPPRVQRAAHGRRKGARCPAGRARERADDGAARDAWPK